MRNVSVTKVLRSYFNHLRPIRIKRCEFQWPKSYEATSTFEFKPENLLYYRFSDQSLTKLLQHLKKFSMDFLNLFQWPKSYEATSTVGNIGQRGRRYWFQWPKSYEATSTNQDSRSYGNSNVSVTKVLRSYFNFYLFFRKVSLTVSVTKVLRSYFNLNAKRENVLARISFSDQSLTKLLQL